MSIEQRIQKIGVAEAELSAACFTLAALRSDRAAALSALAKEHRAAALALGSTGARIQEMLATARALVALVLPGGALDWLREREHQLVRTYLALDTLELEEETRRALRQEKIPSAYDRYSRVDRLVAGLGAEGTPA